MSKNISMPVIRRLPRYYRFVSILVENGVERISSEHLAEVMGITASQIRQDFSCFGGFGQQGYGYNLESLKLRLSAILGITQETNAILIGCGNLGSAISNMNFAKYGIHLRAVFDRSDKLIGKPFMSTGLAVSNVNDLESYVADNIVDMAILCIPKLPAPEVAKRLTDLDVKSVWNFSHYDMNQTYRGVVVENVHLGDSLMVLKYRCTHLGQDVFDND